MYNILQIAQQLTSEGLPESEGTPDGTFEGTPEEEGACEGNIEEDGACEGTPDSEGTPDGAELAKAALTSMQTGQNPSRMRQHSYVASSS